MEIDYVDHDDSHSSSNAKVGATIQRLIWVQVLKLEHLDQMVVS